MESGYSCVCCQKKFNRDDNLKRHMKSQHRRGNKQHTDGNQKSEMDLQLSQFALRHPFTLMVAASTGGGKTWFVKDLLENREQSSGFLLHHSEPFGSMVSGNPCMQRCRKSYHA